jgi:hypothetical protein
MAPPTGMMSNLVMSLFLRMHSAISRPLVAAIWRWRSRREETSTWREGWRSGKYEKVGKLYQSSGHFRRWIPRVAEEAVEFEAFCHKYCLGCLLQQILKISLVCVGCQVVNGPARET